jgi:protein-disulfide isomerase
MKFVSQTVREAGPLSRRLFFQGGASAAALLTMPGAWSVAHAQWADRVPETVPVDELMKPDALEEIVIGQEDAPVTIVEYASMSCGHCARFHSETLPVLKERYIEPGKAKLIFREFPLDLGAAWASMIGRCADSQDRGLELTDALFKRQADWARGTTEEEVKLGLLEVLEPLGMTRDSIDACVSDRILLHNIAQRAVRAGRDFGVTATPTFFINGLKLEGAAPIEDFEAIIEPLL